MNRLAERVQRKVTRALSGPLEKALRLAENPHMSRGEVLTHIPPANLRGGGLGTTTYGEWCYTIGLFQTLIFQNLPSRPVRMLDVGCGVGRLYLAAKPYLTASDEYIGIDITERSIAICREKFAQSNVSFMHTLGSNRYYASNATEGDPRSWVLESGSFNLVTALSVWTHLREEDWKYYLAEVARVLAPGGKAIITFFVLDELYKPELKSSKKSLFYPQPENKWIFDRQAYESKDWKYPSWAEVPEVAVGVPKHTFDQEVRNAGLEVVHYLPGQWKDQPGFFFQDVVVFEKRGG